MVGFAERYRTMEKRTLGDTGLEVTVLGYGAMAIRANEIPAGKDDTDNASCRLLNQVLEAGVSD